MKKSKKTVLIEFSIIRSLVDGLTQDADYLIEGLLENGEQLLLYGQPKVGKTFLAIQLACALACGKPFLIWKVNKRRKVLYLNFEMGERVFAERIARHLEPSANEIVGPKRGKHFDDQLENHLVFTVQPRSVEVFDHGEKLKALILQEKPEFVVFDTLSKLHSEDERENNAIQRVLTEVRNICQVDGKPIAHMIVHHARKTSINIDERAIGLTAAEIRGGSAIRGEADVIMGLAKNPGGAGGGSMTTLIMEARNVDLENLDIEFGADLIFRPAETQSKILIKDAFYKKLKAAKDSLVKTKLVEELAQEFHQQPDTVGRNVNAWLSKDRSIEKKQDPKDKRRVLIRIATTDGGKD